MTFLETEIPGFLEIHPAILRDERGSFTKTFQAAAFAEKGLQLVFAEEYHTVSKKNVLRGLHFQVPPAACAKIVSCVSGTVTDAVVDLRKGSPAYGKFAVRTLGPETGTLLYIPPGVAHGFYVVDGDAVMLYKVTAPYSPPHDTGILWNSAGIPWPSAAPIVSARDRAFAPLGSFDSPFVFDSRRRG